MTATVICPELCRRHMHNVVFRKLRMRTYEPWQASVVVVRLLLTQRAIADDAVAQRAENDAAQLPRVIAELGCLACRYPDALGPAVALVKRGLPHASKVARGAANDPEWPWGTGGITVAT